jgi:hypothetical protein
MNCELLAKSLSRSRKVLWLKGFVCAKYCIYFSLGSSHHSKRCLLSQRLKLGTLKLLVAHRPSPWYDTGGMPQSKRLDP